MTLFIAYLLIYHYNMEWWWYGVAGGIWLLGQAPAIVAFWES
jgi:hypothetical protein